MKNWQLFFPLILFPILLLSIDEKDLLVQRERMVAEQIRARGIAEKHILNAFLKVKRHLFVPPFFLDWAYADRPLPIEEDQTISQPYIVALMTETIAPSSDKKILEIGTGSGYQAAILAELVREVYSVEIKPKLAEKAKALLNDLGYRNIHFKIGDGFLGWEEYAPYDGIIVTCSPDSIPEPLIEQLAIGGRMVIPIESSNRVQNLVLVERTAIGKIKKKKLIPVRFVPLIREKP